MESNSACLLTQAISTSTAGADLLELKFILDGGASFCLAFVADYDQLNL